MLLSFDVCETEKCVDLRITDDVENEPDEVFFYHLIRTPNLDPRIDLSPVCGQIKISSQNG